MNSVFTIEMAPFSVAEGVPPEELLAASERLERDFLAGAEGYVGRVLLQKDPTQWVDLVVWRSADAAAKAMKAAASSPACRAYFACMKAEDHDAADHGVTMYRAVKAYGALRPAA